MIHSIQMSPFWWYILPNEINHSVCSLTYHWLSFLYYDLFHRLSTWSLSQKSLQCIFNANKYICPLCHDAIPFLPFDAIRWYLPDTWWSIRQISFYIVPINASFVYIQCVLNVYSIHPSAQSVIESLSHSYSVHSVLQMNPIQCQYNIQWPSYSINV